MDEALAVQAVGHARLLHQPDKAGFQHARADPTQHIVAGLAFQHHGLDPLLVQQLTQQKPRGTAADDDNLCAHGDSSCLAGLHMEIRMEIAIIRRLITKSGK